MPRRAHVRWCRREDANYNSTGVYAWTVPLTGKWQECSGSTCDYHYLQGRFGVCYNGTCFYTVLTKS